MGKRGRARKRRGEQLYEPLPANFVATLERGQVLYPELQAGNDLRENVQRRREELRNLIARFDAGHLLAQVSMGEAITDPDSYRESDHLGQAYVVELLAAELLCRPGRQGTEAVTPPIDGRVLDEIRRLIQEAVLLETFRRHRAAGAKESPEGDARGRAATQNLMLRNPGWPWQEHDLLRGLFGEQRFAAALRKALGFDADQAIQLTSAALTLMTHRVHEHMSSAREGAASFDSNHPAHRWASTVFDASRWQQAPEEQQALYIPFLWAMNHVGDSLVITPAALGEEAQIDATASGGLLQSLAVGFGQNPTEDWFAAAERVRYKPFAELEPDNYMLTVPGNDLWALRGLMESVLKTNKGYIRHRGSWLESRSAELLNTALKADATFTSLDFDYKDDAGNERHGEIDALMLCDDAAIAVEAKSATLRPGARRGGEALVSHLRETLTKAAEQGTRARQALHARGARFTAGNTSVDLNDRVHEVHPVVVTLDDLSSVAPVLWQLEGTRVLPEGTTLPWVVTLHELDQVCQTVEWPVQLVHFLRRRSRLNALGNRIASDELDWWMHYLRYGLYFEEDDPRLQRVLSLTDDLDAWMLWAHGERETSAPKPSMNLDKRTRDFLDLLCEERPNGWVAAGCSLLEPHGEARVRLWKEAERLRRRAERRNLIQRGTLGFGTGPTPMLICFIAVPDSQSRFLLPALEKLVDERLEEHGEQRVLGFGLTAGSTRPYDALLVVERSIR